MLQQHCHGKVRDMEELIVKFNGNIADAVYALGGKTELITCDTAIVTLPDGSADMLAALSQTEYYEYAEDIAPVSVSRSALSASGISYANNTGLDGNGVIIGIADSGIDLAHPEFIGSDGRSRILFIYDTKTGMEYDNAQINRALLSKSPYDIIPVRDTSGHGTAVSCIAAGNSGAAPAAGIISVKLGGRTTDILRAVRYITDKGIGLGMPAAINISYGMNLGSHTGDSLFEKCLDDMCGRWKLSVCAAAGNEGGSGHHFSTVMKSNETADADFAAVFPFNELFLDVWRDFSTVLEFELISPDGISTGTLRGDAAVSVPLGKTAVTVYSRPVTHYSSLCRTLFRFSPGNTETAGGIWKLRIKCLYALDGRIDIWLPTSEMIGNNASFLYPDDLFTLTVPAAVPGVITAAGYDHTTDSIAYFSGRGIRAIAKPDIAAPAVGILSARAGGGYDSFSGTSMAAPFVCAAAALLMQYGIANGSDPFLYGEKLKALLCLSARRRNRTYPDDSFGYGTLDLEKAVNILNGGYP